MCLIIFSPNLRRARISKGVLEKVFLKNDDGAGIAYVKDGKLTVTKGLMTFPEFYDAYLPIRTLVAAAGGPLLIHFRWGSCGLITEANTQPAVVRDDLVLAHNGTIDSLTQEAETLETSDSHVLARKVKNLRWPFPFTKPQLDILKAVADDSRLVFLDNHAHYQIINQAAGKWSRGAWYSDGGTILEKDPKSWWDKSPHNAHNQMGGTPPGPLDDDDFSDEDNEREFEKAMRMAEKVKITQMPGVNMRPKESASTVGSKLRRWEVKKRVTDLMADAHRKGIRFDPDGLDSEEWIAWNHLKSDIVS